MIAFIGFDAAGLMRNAATSRLFTWEANATWTEIMSTTLTAIDEQPFYSSYMVPWWSAFGDYNGSDFDFMGAVFMWLYCLVAQAILVNLLVAIYADQYTKVLESADAESAKMRLSSIFNYRAVLLAVPPPFNLPLTLYYLFAGEQIGLFRRLVTYIKTGGAAIATPMRVHPVMMAGFGMGGEAAVAKYPMDESVEAKKARRRYIERVNNEENAEGSVLEAVEEMRERQATLEEKIDQIKRDILKALGNKQI